MFKFSEFSDKAKEKAISDYRSDDLGYEWWDGVYMWAEEAANLLGIDLDKRKNRPYPAIYFSGFCSQGDGACFEGDYRYRKGSYKEIVEHYPNERELHRIAKGLQEIQRKQFYKLVATVQQSGRYYDMAIDVEHSENRYQDIGESEENIKERLRDFAHWIYNKLEEEYDYLTSDATIAETLEVNDYLFDEFGNWAG